ncbi:SMI1/KNR4 family protein [Kitasatospora sp. NPDC054939]
MAALLQDVARASDGLVKFDAGITDERMDAWAVPVPDGLRALFREIGGIRIQVGRVADNGYVPAEHISFDHAYDTGLYNGYNVSWYQDHAGGVGSHRFLYTDHGDGHTYVDVDRTTGHWGPVLVFWDATDTQLLAPSLEEWLRHLAACLRAALDGAGTEPHAFGRAFADRWDPTAERPVDLPVLDVAGALAGGDPVLARIAAGLPADARLADLRGADGVARVEFGPWATCRYARHENGAVLSAVPWDGE